MNIIPKLALKILEGKSDKMNKMGGKCRNECWYSSTRYQDCHYQINHNHIEMYAANTILPFVD